MMKRLFPKPDYVIEPVEPVEKVEEILEEIPAETEFEEEAVEVDELAPIEEPEEVVEEASEEEVLEVDELSPIEETTELRKPSFISIWLSFPLIKLFFSILNNDSKTKKLKIPNKIELIEIWTPPILKPIKIPLAFAINKSTETPQIANSTKIATIHIIGLNNNPIQNSVLTNDLLFILKVFTHTFNNIIWCIIALISLSKI